MHSAPEFRYRLVRRIAVDPERVIFVGEQQGAARFVRRVAIKIFRAEFGPLDDLLDSIRHQSRLSSAVHHSTLVPVCDTGIHDGCPYLVFDYCDGPDLAALLARIEQRGQRPSPAMAVRMISRVAFALHHLHSSGAPPGPHHEPVHGGLCPGRILVEVSGQVKVLGMGAPLRDLAYSSPEQVRGDALTGRSDLFSLGSILYEALSGVQPFRQSTEHRTTAAILGHDPEPPSAHRRDLPAALDTVTLACLSRDPDGRPESGRAVGQALADWLGPEPPWEQRAELTRVLARSFPERLQGSVGHGPSRPPSWEPLVHRLSARVVPLPSQAGDGGGGPIRLISPRDGAGPGLLRPDVVDGEQEPLGPATGSIDA